MVNIITIPVSEIVLTEELMLFQPTILKHLFEFFPRLAKVSRTASLESKEDYEWDTKYPNPALMVAGWDKKHPANFIATSLISFRRPLMIVDPWRLSGEEDWDYFCFHWALAPIMVHNKNMNVGGASPTPDKTGNYVRDHFKGFELVAA